MGRAPCCEKAGLKKGPWSPEEDKILQVFVQNHGHGNWRALPKQAGLLRCGKSCRLRWINYLRPDIKRGNFSEEEEDTVIKLHRMLGNKWSAIAASLPGRTDNEIKNVWHTHLKKRVEQNQSNLKPTVSKKSKPKKFQTEVSTEFSSSSSSEVSSVADGSASMSEKEFNVNGGEIGCFVDERSWSETPLGFTNAADNLNFDCLVESAFDYDSPSPDDDCMDFWYNVFVNAGGKHEL